MFGMLGRIVSPSGIKGAGSSVGQEFIPSKAVTSLVRWRGKSTDNTVSGREGGVDVPRRDVERDDAGRDRGGELRKGGGVRIGGDNRTSSASSAVTRDTG